MRPAGGRAGEEKNGDGRARRRVAPTGAARRRHARGGGRQSSAANNKEGKRPRASVLLLRTEHGKATRNRYHVRRCFSRNKFSSLSAFFSAVLLLPRRVRAPRLVLSPACLGKLLDIRLLLLLHLVTAGAKAPDELRSTATRGRKAGGVQNWTAQTARPATPNAAA